MVLGLDLSLTSPAIAFIEDGHLVHVGNIKTTGKKQASQKNPEGATTADRHARLMVIRNWLRVGLEDGLLFKGLDMAVIEAPAVGSTLGSMHDRSGLWWLVVDLLTQYGVAVVEVSPAGRCKYITGHGRQDKKVVLAHAIERYADNLHAACGLRIKNDDIADAIGLADMGARRLGMPVVADMPADNLAAMDGVLWPSL